MHVACMHADCACMQGTQASFQQRVTDVVYRQLLLPTLRCVTIAKRVTTVHVDMQLMPTCRRINR
jgi:hypothetical protein